MSTTGATPEARRARRRSWIITLWLVQVLLASMFATSGLMKATMPIDELAQSLGWPGDIPGRLVRFIGVAELAAAVGLILPAATRIVPVLTPLAGAGLTVVMLLAAVFHAMRGEFQAIPFNLALGALAALVAWGRVSKAPIASR